MGSGGHDVPPDVEIWPPPPRRPPREERGVPSTSWLGVAAVGGLVFLVGVWTPVWRGVADGLYLGDAVAAAGGVGFVVGLTYWGRARAAERRPRGLAALPGVELYDPHAPPTGPTDAEPEPDRDRGAERGP